MSKSLSNRSPHKIPPTFSGMKVGLFGGSFNPAHAGHAHVSNIALRKLQLDQLWWIVSPGNPLKDHNELLPLDERIARCRQIAAHPDIHITAFEATYNLGYSADTIKLLKQRRADTNFVWIMGADNLANFHRWERWSNIADMVPIAVIDRPDSTTSPNSSAATHALAKFRMDERDSGILANTKAPVWTFIHGKRSYLSSTKIRNGNLAQ